MKSSARVLALPAVVSPNPFQRHPAIVGAWKDVDLRRVGNSEDARPPRKGEADRVTTVEFGLD